MTLGEVLGQAEAILLDFDGPVCSIFAGLPASAVAVRLKDLLVLEGVRLPPDVEALDDPLKVLRRSAEIVPELVDTVETALMASEVEAATCAEITPGVREFLRACAESGRPVAIVSNNSEPAIATFLALADLGEWIEMVSGRPIGEPDQMKPHPGTTLRACKALGVEPERAVLIGDSDFDMEAASAAGTRSIGYANEPGKAESLTRAGADTLTDDMYSLAQCWASEDDPQDAVDRYAYCAIYIQDLSPDEVIRLIWRAPEEPSESPRLGYIDGVEIEVRRNPDADPTEMEFLYWPVKVEVAAGRSVGGSTVVAVVARILTSAWNAGHAAVAACDYEEELPDRGGYPRYRS
ncbi:HAD family hydrolase [Nonomuraea sp. NPDC059194]|uniref:HAD family hydrolase n=1 Tax=Nonomuraea sp. NPDC059194 TaxID=3346764 RepID=UPI0036A31701